MYKKHLKVNVHICVQIDGIRIEMRDNLSKRYLDTIDIFKK